MGWQMSVIRTVFRWLGMGLYGINFAVLVGYGYKVLMPGNMTMLDVLLLVISPVFMFIGIKFFMELKKRLTVPVVMYAGLFFMMHSGLWLGSVLVFLLGYFLEETIGRGAGLAGDGYAHSSDDMCPYAVKILGMEYVYGGEHISNGIELGYTPTSNDHN